VILCGDLYQIYTSADKNRLIAENFEEDYGIGVLPDDLFNTLSEQLQILCSEIEAIQLPMTLKGLQRLQETVTLKESSRQLIPLLNEVQNILQYELESIMFFKILNELMEYYQDHHVLFGERVMTQFSSASYDIAEAGKCLALGRNTACVFHLMRVLEIGLTAFWKVFGISLPHTNWQPAVKQIGSVPFSMKETGDGTPRKSPRYKV
jgi:hypothetical protein